jgi:homoserine kinase type II
MTAEIMFDLSPFWDVPATAEVTPLDRGGYNNSLYRVTINGASPYVLRVYGNHANPKYIQHELTVLSHLQARGLPFAVPAPIPTKRNELWAMSSDGRARKLMVLLPFIPGDNPQESDLAQAEAAGEAMAILLGGLREVNVRGLQAPQPYIELGRVHPLVPDAYEAMNCLGSLAPNSVKKRIDAILEYLFEQTKPIKALPQQLIHGDLITGNMLMEGARMTGILDFENCTANPRAMDFAIALDAWSWDALGTGNEWARMDALGRGYARVSKLTDAEIAALPALILLRNASVLMHLVGRFLSNLTPYVDIENWLDSMLKIDAWLTLNKHKLLDRAGGW